MIERIIEIQASRDVCFDVIADFRAYPNFLKTTTKVDVIERSEKLLHAIFSVNVIKEISYTLEFRLNRPVGMSWSLVRGDLMSRNDGSWMFEAISPQTTRAIYRIDVQFGWLVPQKIVDMLTETQLPDLMRSFKDRVESVARSQDFKRGVP